MRGPEAESGAVLETICFQMRIDVRRVMWQGEVTTPSTGEPVRFLETLKA